MGGKMIPKTTKIQKQHKTKKKNHSRSTAPKFQKTKIFIQPKTPRLEKWKFYKFRIHHIIKKNPETSNNRYSITNND